MGGTGRCFSAERHTLSGTRENGRPKRIPISSRNVFLGCTRNANSDAIPTPIGDAATAGAAKEP
jgi:hypothetical protein